MCFDLDDKTWVRDGIDEDIIDGNCGRAGTDYVFCRIFRSIRTNYALPGSNLVLIQFGFRGFSFLSHAGRLWFVVFSKLASVSLDHYIIPFQPG